jgi:dihydroneopterin aldolase
MTKAAPDTIRISGIRGYGYHGVLDAERALGQSFIVDIALRLDVAAAAGGDDLTRTVDYGLVATAVHDRITGPAVALIETLAEQIAADCLAHGAVASVDVTVHKPQAPVAVPFDDISITVTRSS